MVQPADVPKRQATALAALASALEEHPNVLGALLVGSLARGGGDALSDIDCIVVTSQGAFDEVWHSRCSLHGSTVTTCWDHTDEGGPPDARAHKWLDDNLVLVECLITTPASGVRLAPPHRVLTGPDDLATHLEARPPIERDEMTAVGDRFARDLDVETAYDLLKDAVRRRRDG